MLGQRPRRPYRRSSMARPIQHAHLVTSLAALALACGGAAERATGGPGEPYHDETVGAPDTAPDDVIYDVPTHANAGSAVGDSPAGDMPPLPAEAPPRPEPPPSEVRLGS